MKSFRLGIASFTIFAMLSASPARADAAINVACSDVSGLINAIRAANQKPLNTTTTINLNADTKKDCSYYLAVPYESTANGLPIITSNLTINGNSSLIYTSAGDFRVFEINAIDQIPSEVAVDQETHPPATLTLTNMTVSGGKAIDELSADCPSLIYSPCGGAIHNSGTTNLIDTKIIGGSAAYGGGIFSSGFLSLLRSSVSSSSSSISGGGIYTSGNATIVDSQIESNTAEDAGGGILNTGTLEISQSVISQNYARHSGGGIYNNSYLEIDDSTISTNSVLTELVFNEEDFSFETGIGGGILSYGNARISDSFVTGNSGAGGAGLVHNGQELELSGSMISYNTATYYAGGIEIASVGTTNISDSEIIGNQTTSGSGGGIAAFGFGHASVSDTTIRANYATYGGGIYMSADVSLDGVVIASNYSFEGGGINAYGAELTARDTAIEGNSATGVGGGIVAWDNSTVSLVGGSVRSNIAGEGGGGIGNFGTLPLIAAATDISGNSPDNCSGLVVTC